MGNLAAPDRAPEKKAFVLVTLAPPQEVIKEIDAIKSWPARDFAFKVWKTNNRVITWACPELVDRIVPEEREGLKTLLFALEAGTLPESRIVGPGHSAFMIATGQAIAPAREIQKVSFERPIGVPLEVKAQDDYGKKWSGVAGISEGFNLEGAVGQCMTALNATDLTGTVPDRSLSAALETGAEGASAELRTFRYEI